MAILIVAAFSSRLSRYTPSCDVCDLFAGRSGSSAFRLLGSSRGGDAMFHESDSPHHAVSRALHRMLSRNQSSSCLANWSRVSGAMPDMIRR
jgi:hypothetical protein